MPITSSRVVPVDRKSLQRQRHSYRGQYPGHAESLSIKAVKLGSEGDVHLIRPSAEYLGTEDA